MKAQKLDLYGKVPLAKNSNRLYSFYKEKNNKWNYYVTEAGREESRYSHRGDWGFNDVRLFNILWQWWDVSNSGIKTNYNNKTST